MNRRQLTVNRAPSSSRRRVPFTPPRCESVKPGGPGALRCLFDTGHNNPKHFCDGYEWTDVEAAA